MGTDGNHLHLFLFCSNFRISLNAAPDDLAAMHVALFKALKSVNIADEAATGVVDGLQRYVESVVTYNIQAVQGDLAALRGEFRGELAAFRGEMRGEMKGMSAAIDALKHQVTLMGILISIVGLAIAAGPIVAKFIH